MRRFLRILGTLMIVAGVGALAWAFTVWKWEDPFTATLNYYEQRQLAKSFDRRLEEGRPPGHHTDPRRRARDASRQRGQVAPEPEARGLRSPGCGSRGSA